MPCGYEEGRDLFAGCDRSKEQVCEAEVEAGTWRSRILADSNLGFNFLCHTLVPNVTVDFSSPGGNSFALQWGVTRGYVQKTRDKRVYVHDREEDVVLNTHAIRYKKGISLIPSTVNSPLKFPRTIPSIAVGKMDLHDRSLNVKKVQAVPRLTVHPDPPSQKLPCKSDPGYSQVSTHTATIIIGLDNIVCFARTAASSSGAGCSA